jgi:hypothetical protein
MNNDRLASNLRAANEAHVAALRTGDQRAIRTAYIAALEAERDLLVDCGGEVDMAAASDLEYQIEDERAALTRMPALALMALLPVAWTLAHLAR